MASPPSNESNVAFSHLVLCQLHEEQDCPKCSAEPVTAPVLITRPPDIGMDDSEVEQTEFFYSDRAPEDWVISGPLGESGHGRGRYFPTWRDAEQWARGFYKVRFKGRLPDEPNSGGRYAFLIKGPRGHTNVSYARAYERPEVDKDLLVVAAHEGPLPKNKQ